MVDNADNCICPKCGHKGLFINTEDWKPVKIRCRRIKCDWSVDLKQHWPKKSDGMVPLQ